MMRAVAVIVFSLTIHVHGQSTSPALDSPSSSKPTTFAASAEAAYASYTEMSFSMLSSTSSGPLAVSDVTSITEKNSTLEMSSSMATSDSQSAITCTRVSMDRAASSTAVAIPSSAEMPEPSTTFTDAMSTYVSVTTNDPPTPTQSPLSPTELQLAIALPVSLFSCTSLLILLALTVFACRRWRKRQQRDRVGDYSAMYSGTEAATVFDNRDVDNETEAAFKPKPMRITYRPKIPVMSHPLTVAELGALIQNEESIANEFANIPSNMVTMDDIPPGAEAKNRYRNVLPNPHTRVPLFLKFGVANSDYVNANYIRGFTGVPRAFIATQGPLWETTPDFWRMVWEQRSSIIVMLTELEENDMVKCKRYWPDEQEGRTAVYDDIEVTLARRVMEKHYTTTTFLLRHLEKGVTREVIHVWFRAWPDHGAPELTEPFLNFIQTFRSATADLPVGPVIVNCSAGIGRSGVFIASCLGMMSLEDSGEVDILKLVSTMRQDRGGMVQSRTQYIFLHKVLYEYGLCLEKAKAPTSSFLLND